MNASNKKLSVISKDILVPKVLNLKCNNIKKIENIPEGVEDLDLSFNQIRVIENLPVSLKVLRLDHNLIRKIQNIPRNLHTLYINGNRIHSIDSCFINNIMHLYINNNPLKILPYMHGLVTLHVENCNLRDVSLLPPGLKELFIRYNSITIIKKLPTSLKSFMFSHNPIRVVHLSGIPTSLHQRFKNYNKKTVKMRVCDTCGICREKFKPKEPIIYCKYSCGIPIHSICFEHCRYNSCAFCRTTIECESEGEGNFINDSETETVVSSQSESDTASEYSEESEDE
jgi:hypothetical protein